MNANMQAALSQAPSLHPSNVSGEWPVADLAVIQDLRRAPPFPLECLGGLGKWVSDTAEGCGAPVDYVAMTTLVSCASLIGNSRWSSPWAGWAEPSILWGVLVGRPSSSKSPAADAVLRHIRDLEVGLAHDYPEKLAAYERDVAVADEERKNWQADVKAAVKEGVGAPVLPEKARDPDKPERPRIVVSDTTTEALCRILKGSPRGLLAVRDELSGWLAFDRYTTGADRPFWLEAFGGRSYPVDRVKENGQPMMIPNLSVSLIGGIQPDKLHSMLISGDDDGLAARALYVWPDPLRPCRPSVIANDFPTIRAMQRLLALQMRCDEDGVMRPYHVRFADDAADAFMQWRLDNDDKQNDASGLFLSHLGKFPGLVVRLSLILEYLHWALEGEGEPEPQSISVRSVGFACHLVDEYFTKMSERAFGDAAIPLPEKHATAIAKKILKAKPRTINVREIRRAWGIPGLRRAEDVRAAVAELEAAGWVRQEGAVVVGRPRLDFEVNPQVLDLGASQ